MTVIISIALCLIVGYFFGCVSTAYIVGKRAGIDIREHGSNSAGATNVLRTLGKKAGIIVFLGDCIKTITAILIMLLARNLAGIELDTETVTLATGLGSVLGHNFPFWLGFKGGKGIAVTSSVILAFCLPDMWICPLICLLLFAIIVKVTKYVSLGSLTVASTFLLFVGLVFMKNENFIRLFLLTFCFTALAFYMHRANIKRLLNGTENKFGAENKNKMVVRNLLGDPNNPNNTNNQDNIPIDGNENSLKNNISNNNVNNQNNNQNNIPNNENVNNNLFIQASDLGNGNVDNLNNNRNINRNINRKNSYVGETSNLYTTQYLNQVEKIHEKEDVNNTGLNTNGVNSFYQDYSDCDTIDETRLLDESEYNEGNGYDSENSNI